MTRYFEMRDNVHVPGRWYLTDPRDRDGRNLWQEFTDGKPVHVEGPVRLAFSKYAERGNPVDYSELSESPFPIVHVRVAEVFVELAPSDVQIIPAEIEGQMDQFCIVNVTRLVKCIDDQKSKEIRYFTPDCEEVFRDQVGEYRAVRGMRIDPTKVHGEKIFRPWGWPVTIIVAEEIKQALERIGTVGVRFNEV